MEVGKLRTRMPRCRATRCRRTWRRVARRWAQAPSSRAYRTSSLLPASPPIRKLISRDRQVSHRHHSWGTRCPTWCLDAACCACGRRAGHDTRGIGGTCRTARRTDGFYLRIYRGTDWWACQGSCKAWWARPCSPNCTPQCNSKRFRPKCLSLTWPLRSNHHACSPLGYLIPLELLASHQKSGSREILARRNLHRVIFSKLVWCRLVSGLPPWPLHFEDCLEFHWSQHGSWRVRVGLQMSQWAPTGMIRGAAAASPSWTTNSWTGAIQQANQSTQPFSWHHYSKILPKCCFDWWSCAEAKMCGLPRSLTQCTHERKQSLWLPFAPGIFTRSYSLIQRTMTLAHPSVHKVDPSLLTGILMCLLLPPRVQTLQVYNPADMGQTAWVLQPPSSRSNGTICSTNVFLSESGIHSPSKS